jgi:hypothetical protein
MGLKFLHQGPLECHIKWVPCQHGMVHPQVADRGDGLQIWRVAANILNKQSQIANRGPSSLRVRRVEKRVS